MEEQMGTLLTTLQEQGQRQEQLAREQANQFSLKLEQLAEEQRERQAEFSRQFSEQLELLARDQRLTLEQWTVRQERMEERVQTLETELRSSIREPLPRAVKAELPEKSCLGTAGTEPSCPLEIESQASSLNPDATEFLPLPAVQETEARPLELGAVRTLTSTGRCSALGATMAEPRGMPTTPSSRCSPASMAGRRRRRLPTLQ